ncbi:MAG: PAS domain-containing sensor histidine kinase, partial [bacterium]
TQHKAAEKALKESEEKFRNLAEQSPNMIFININGRIVYINQKCVQTMGYTEQEFYSPGFSFLSLISPEYKEIVNRYFKKHKTVSDAFSYEFELVTKKNEYLNVQITTKIINYNEKRAILGTVTDISKLKQTEIELRSIKEELEKQNMELKKLDRIKDSLIRDVAHELKTPVAKHSMQVWLLAQKLREQGIYEDYNDIIKVMHSSIKRQELVIRNLLNLSRLEAGGRKYKSEPLCISDIVKEVINDYQSTIDSNNIKLANKLRPINIHSDAEMLFHVFSNIINNAIKYRNQKNHPEIIITGVKYKNRILIKFTDNGIGLARKEIKHVFDEFYQASASAEGTGVGLTICRKIMEDLGGNIFLESRGKNSGTTAVIKLPV